MIVTSFEGLPSCASWPVPAPDLYLPLCLGNVFDGRFIDFSATAKSGDFMGIASGVAGCCCGCDAGFPACLASLRRFNNSTMQVGSGLAMKGC